MKNRILSLASIATLAVVFGMISWGSVFAQTTPSTPADQTTPQTQPTPTPDTPPTQQTPQTQPAPTPEVPPASQQPPSSSTQTPSTPSTQTPSTQTPDQSATPSSKDNTAPANSTPAATAPNAGASASGAATASDGQSFSGTVVKSGDKYMLKDDSGKTYDIDHQSDVAKFEGKRVRVQGKLDDSGSKILVK